MTARYFLSVKVWGRKSRYVYLSRFLCVAPGIRGALFAPSCVVFARVLSDAGSTNIQRPRKKWKNKVRRRTKHMDSSLQPLQPTSFAWHPCPFTHNARHSKLTILVLLQHLHSVWPKFRNYGVSQCPLRRCGTHSWCDGLPTDIVPKIQCRI